MPSQNTITNRISNLSKFTHVCWPAFPFSSEVKRIHWFCLFRYRKRRNWKFFGRHRATIWSWQSQDQTKQWNKNSWWQKEDDTSRNRSINWKKDSFKTIALRYHPFSRYAKFSEKEFLRPSNLYMYQVVRNVFCPEDFSYLGWCLMSEILTEFIFEIFQQY